MKRVKSKCIRECINFLGAKFAKEQAYVRTYVRMVCMYVCMYVTMYVVPRHDTCYITHLKSFEFLCGFFFFAIIF